MICFHSLRTGKPIQSRSICSDSQLKRKFRFPSNGKAYPKQVEGDYYNFQDLLFRFPSNGKAYPKPKKKSLTGLPKKRVSIPFQRESVSKVDIEMEEETLVAVSIPFQRESVSKAKPINAEDLLRLYCFDSLPTGKRIQRTTKSRSTLMEYSFDSLPTGKRIQRCFCRNIYRE